MGLYQPDARENKKREKKRKKENVSICLRSVKSIYHIPSSKRIQNTLRRLFSAWYVKVPTVPRRTGRRITSPIPLSHQTDLPIADEVGCIRFIHGQIGSQRVGEMQQKPTSTVQYVPFGGPRDPPFGAAPLHRLRCCRCRQIWQGREIPSTECYCRVTLFFFEMTFLSLTRMFVLLRTACEEGSSLRIENLDLGGVCFGSFGWGRPNN